MNNKIITALLLFTLNGCTIPICPESWVPEQRKMLKEFEISPRAVCSKNTTGDRYLQTGPDFFIFARCMQDGLLPSESLVKVEKSPQYYLTKAKDCGFNPVGEKLSEALSEKQTKCSPKYFNPTAGAGIAWMPASLGLSAIMVPIGIFQSVAYSCVSYEEAREIDRQAR